VLFAAIAKKQVAIVVTNFNTALSGTSFYRVVTAAGAVEPTGRITTPCIITATAFPLLALVSAIPTQLIVSSVCATVKSAIPYVSALEPTESVTPVLFSKSPPLTSAEAIAEKNRPYKRILCEDILLYL